MFDPTCVASGIYLFEDDNDTKNRTYVGRTENFDRRFGEHGEKRIKNYIARIEFAMDDIFDKFNFPVEKNKFTNHLKLIEQWFIEEIGFSKTSNKRNEISPNPSATSKNSRPIRNILSSKIKLCD